MPSNPWVAIGWRKRSDIEVDMAAVMKRKGIRLLTQGAQRVNPADNRIELADGSSINYDYLVIATGPELAFDEIPGLGPDGHTQSVCHVDHACHAQEAFEKLAANPGPVVIGAVQGASCFGPAYEFLFILEAELRRRKLRDRVPMTFVTSEPYIGHLGLDGVGDTKGLLEREMREKHIKWITNARVKSVAPDTMSVEEIADDGSVRKTHEVPFAYSMMLPAFRGVAAVRGIEKLTNPRGFVIVDKYQRNPEFKNVFAIGVCVAIAPVGATPVPVGVPKTGFMIELMVTATARNIGSLLRGESPTAQPTWNAICLADFGEFRRRLPGAAADSAAQRQLVLERRMGSLRQGRLREILPAQDPARRERAVLRALPARQAQHRKSQRDRTGGMSTSQQIVCGHCGKINRLPAERAPGAARCGSCHQPIFGGHPIEVDEAGFSRHVASTDIPVLVDVWAPWCGPCRAMAPMFERAAQQLEPRVRLLKLNCRYRARYIFAARDQRHPYPSADARRPRDFADFGRHGCAKNCRMDNGRARPVLMTFTPTQRSTS